MTKSRPAKRRQIKFLVVVDETPEARIAMRFAGRAAKRVKGEVCLLMVLAPAVFQHWLGVETIMQEEALEGARSVMGRLAREMARDAGITPQIVIREGEKSEAVIAVIGEDPALTSLVMAAAAPPSHPGPLVERIAGEGFPLPVIVVPENLSDEHIDALA